MIKVLFLSLILCAYDPIHSYAAFKEGDLIFHESRSAQSLAIKEATRSRWSHVGIVIQEKNKWYVAEAVQPVKYTPLASFVQRGVNKEYKVLRLKELKPSDLQKIKTEIKKYIGKSYDIYFEWSDDLIYCSEFVYKVFNSAIGIEVGRIQKFKDMRMDGPYVKELIRRRLTDTGRQLHLEELIVTPATQAEDPKFQEVSKD